jgi:hypothetical protein
MPYRFSSKLWMYAGENPWYFVTLPADMSDEIEHRTAHRKRGFGSVRVRATVGSTTWDTSIFPSTQAGAYILPMKKPVRTAEKLIVDKPVAVSLDVPDLDGP